MFDPARPDREKLAAIPFGQAWLQLAGPPRDAHDVTSRLAMYRLLVERSNPRGAFGARDELSPWWGYASQLAWQHASGRLGGDDQKIADDSWWGACNYALSVVPYVAAASLGLVPAVGERVGADYLPALAAWRTALESARALEPGGDHDAVRVAFWRAHIASIHIAVRRHRRELAAMPAGEQRFARGWIRMVDLFGAAAVATDLEQLVRPTGGVTLPARVLDGGDTSFADLPRGQRGTTRRVAALADRPRWRWQIELRAWQRVMRTRAARSDAEKLLAALLGRGRQVWPGRARALAYLVWGALIAGVVGCGGGASKSSVDAAHGDVGASIDAPRGTPALQSSRQICKLLSERNTSDPTANDVQFRANMLGADLGIPAVANDQVFVLFGDTIGFAGIWGNGQSHPDAVGYAMDSASAVAATPDLLCSRLGILTLPPGSSVGPTVDSRVQADFAAGTMAAPSGHTLDEYIHNPAGSDGSRFAYLPGDFEVPSGAFSYGGAIYIFYTTVVSTTDVTMKASYLAKWAAPATSGIPGYAIQYAIDERFDGAGALFGDFINISAEVWGDYVYLFGTGDYRASPVHLARKRLAELASPGGFELYDAASGTWSATRGAPVIATAGYGETSVRYFANVDRWMFLAEELTPSSNRIVAYFADRPEGPWSAPIIVHDMADAAFTAQYCCTVDNACDGVQFMNCDHTGFYGSYLLPAAATDATGFRVDYTLSSFDPYNVALFEARFSP